VFLLIVEVVKITAVAIAPPTKKKPHGVGFLLTLKRRLKKLLL
jgi:hypothetical protein